MRLKQKGKLALRFVGPIKILECVGKVVYQLTLLMSINMIHNVFHISLLHKQINDLTHLLRVENVELKDNLVYEECLIQILNKRVKQLKNK